jgi:casein kinase II subunit alpha
LEKIKNYEKKEWKSFVNENNKYLINNEVIDLLEKLLKFDPGERIKAKDAIKHPYFKEINSDSED